ncbi:elongation factor Ts [Striga asiatica]|uniref:Elongation factor Ts n=1 Tax=Striga asiatica TaxID=4170 RepID=A0A5A7QCZ6_STRAF|nr:elongation factor Ts [Striga asiatica]
MKISLTSPRGRKPINNTVLSKRRKALTVMKSYVQTTQRQLMVVYPRKRLQCHKQERKENAFSLSVPSRSGSILADGAVRKELHTPSKYTVQLETSHPSNFLDERRLGQLYRARANPVGEVGLTGPIRLELFLA